MIRKLMILVLKQLAQTSLLAAIWEDALKLSIGMQISYTYRVRGKVDIMEFSESNMRQVNMVKLLKRATSNKNTS